jgi:hypothetical protein
VSLLHEGTRSCRRQPTSSWIHKFLGSVPSALHVALQLDAGTCAAFSLFPKISLRQLPYETPHAPLQTSFPVDLAPFLWIGLSRFSAGRPLFIMDVQLGHHSFVQGFPFCSVGFPTGVDLFFCN